MIPNCQQVAIVLTAFPILWKKQFSLSSALFLKCKKSVNKNVALLRIYFIDNRNCANTICFTIHFRTKNVTEGLVK